MPNKPSRKLTPVSFTRVALEGGFLGAWVRTNHASVEPTRNRRIPAGCGG
jgi:hypothetical protein